MASPAVRAVEWTIADYFLKGAISQTADRFAGSSSGNRSVRTMFDYVAAVLALGGYAFCVVALYLTLAANYSSEIAMVSVGGILIVSSIAIWGVFFAIDYYRHRRMLAFKDDVTHALNEFVDSFDESVSDTVRENPKSYALLALLVGYFSGERLSL